MGEKKGFFQSIFGGSSEPTFSEEEEKQRSYALSQQNDDNDSEDIAPASSSVQEPQEEGPSVPEDVVQFITTTLDEWLYLSNLNGKTVVKRNTASGLWLDISDSDDVSRIIGRDGQTLDAFQTLIRSITYKKFKAPYRLNIDAGDYKQRRFSRLKSQVLRASREVTETGESVELDPMAPDERRYVHLLLEKRSGVSTSSTGDGNQRRIVIAADVSND